jgi:hypothetical protein
MLPEKIGQLYVTGYDLPFSTMKVTKAISGMNNKIIECRWNENRWEFMRERLDKSYPNHYNTAIGRKKVVFLLVGILFCFEDLIFNLKRFVKV